MRKYLLILISLSVVLGTSCKDDPAPEPEKQYNMPLKVGNKWIYTVSDVDTFGDADPGGIKFTDTVEVLYKITRDMLPGNPASDIFDRYDWYMVEGTHKKFGAVCNAGDNLVLSIPNLQATVSIDTLVQDTDEIETLFSYKSDVFFSEYRKGYGKPVNIAGYPSKCNMTYTIVNADSSMMYIFAYYYAKGIGLTRFGTRYDASGSYEQYTLKSHILK